MQETTSETIEFPATSRDALTELLRRGAQEMLATAKDASGTTSDSFDSSGNQEVVVETSGNRTTNTLDYENRLSQVVQPGAGNVSTFSYDPVGRRVQKQDSTGTTRFIWDGENYLAETDGSRFVETMLSVIETCRQQRRNLFEYETGAVVDRLAHQHHPRCSPGREWPRRHRPPTTWPARPVIAEGLVTRAKIGRRTFTPLGRHKGYIRQSSWRRVRRRRGHRRRHGDCHFPPNRGEARWPPRQ